MAETSEYLFVYGSLLDKNNEFGSYLSNNCAFFEKGRFKGILYDIGKYPGAIVDSGSSCYVHGSIFKIVHPVEVLEILDNYEGFGSEYAQPNEFIREVTDVEVGDNLLKCWAYLYNLPVKNLPVITNGDYFSYINI